MKYIDRKVIKGKPYYYIQYQGYSKHLGAHLPEDLKWQLMVFFLREVSKKEFDKLSKAVKSEFRFGGLRDFEENHHAHIVFHHELWKSDHEVFYSELIRLFTYHSNRSEGSKTTKKEVDAFAAKKIRNPKTRTDMEISNSFSAFNYALSKEMKWSTKGIRHVHKLLLDGLDPLIAGKWKNENNTVGNQMTVDHKDVPKAMKSLIDWLKKEFKKGAYPPKIALEFYVRFEQIHPFLDGNGRTGRILLNAILHRFNYPPVVFFSENHQQHSAAIQEATKGRWGKMRKHFLEQAKKTDEAVISQFIQKELIS